MSNNNPSSPHFSSFAKILLSDWPALFEIIRSISLAGHQQNTNDQEPTLSPMLSDIELADALNGPFQVFMQQKIHAYACLARFRMHLAIANDEQLKSKIPSDSSISEKQLQQLSLNDLKKIQDKLTQLAREDFQEYLDLLKQHKERLLQELLQADIQLNEHEIQLFLINEPHSVIHERFSELKLKIPKSKYIGSFEPYLKSHLYLIIHSSLSRQHLSHDDSKISPIIKKVEPLLKKTRKETEALAKKQLAIIEELIKPLQISS